MEYVLDKKALIKYFAVALVAIIGLSLTKGYGAIAIALFAIVAFVRKKPVDLLFWVLFMMLSACCNRQIFSVNAVSVLTTRITLLLFAMFLCGASFRNNKSIGVLWGIMWYIVWECLVSIQGFSPIVSYLKIYLFVSVFVALMGISSLVCNTHLEEEAKVRSAIIIMIMIILVGSVALMPFPTLCYMSTEEMIEAMLAGETTSLFKGITSQSQVIGPLAAVMGTFLFADMAFSVKRWDKLYISLLLLCPVLIYKSSSRTGMGTFIAGVGLVAILVMRARGITLRWKGRLTMAIHTVVVTGVVFMLLVPSARDSITQYVTKWGESEQGNVTLQEVMSTRQEKIDIALKNFARKPLFGNGFQVSDEMIHDSRDGIFSYLSAPIEKGVWVFAVLEEGGVVGFILFVGWFIYAIALLIRQGRYVGASVLFAFLTSNLGEFSMFSMTYIGGFGWALVFSSLCIDSLRIRRERLVVPYDNTPYNWNT